MKRQIEGRNPVLEALKAKSSIKKIFIDQNVKPDLKIKKILELARIDNVPVKKINRKVLSKISRTDNHQGIIAFVEVRPTSLSKILHSSKRPFLIILTEVLHEQNLGAILRSAEASGVDAVIIPKKTRGVTPVVARVSMGASEHIPVIEESLFSVLKQIKKEGIQIIGADQQAHEVYFKANLKDSVTFVIGGENKGLTDQIKERCDKIVKIPLHGQIPSLNMSVAAAILLFEKKRQELV